MTKKNFFFFKSYISSCHFHAENSPVTSHYPTLVQQALYCPAPSKSSPGPGPSPGPPLPHEGLQQHCQPQPVGSHHDGGLWFAPHYPCIQAIICNDSLV